MKKYLVWFILVILFSCKKDEPLPIACFTLSKTSADVNEIITATNCSTNASSYLWTDNDGGVATTENASFIYSKPGTYVITLKAYFGSNFNEKQQTVTIIHKTGSVSFWQSGTPSYGNTTVSIGGLTGTITLNKPNGITNCTTSGCANFILPTGTYTFSATDGSHTWNSTVIILADQCVTMKLQ